MAESFRQLRDLLDYCNIELTDDMLSIQQSFPLRVTRFYADLIEKGNPEDPLLLQVMPMLQEQLQTEGYHQDAVGDRQAMPLPGLIQKYHGRVLLNLTGACAIHCRYCFRRHFPYPDASTHGAMTDEIMDYLRTHSEVGEVILSGGDPLMLGDQKLARLIDQLNRLPHVRLLRIHSRLLSVLPQRITGDLIEVLENFNGQLVFVTHINHPREIDERNRTAFSLLHQRGHRLLNQSVLLHRVNDRADILAALSYRLFDCHIMPYYLHRLDKVQGAAHFDLSAEKICILYRQLRNRLPGYLLPRLVQEIPGQLAKTPVHCG